MLGLLNGHRKWVRTTVATLALACGDGPMSPPSTEPPSQRVVSVAFDDSVHVVLVGERFRVRASARDSTGAVIDTVRLTWSSTDTLIGTVDSTGMVHVLRPGQFSIRAAVGATAALAGVTVNLPDPGWRQVSRGCGIWTSGARYCWQWLAPGGPLALRQDLNQLRFDSVYTGIGHSCGLTPEGMAYCWGENRSGQLGNGTVTPSDVPVAVAGGLRFRTMSATSNFTCAVAVSGEVYCWGSNTNGQLGAPSTGQTCGNNALACEVTPQRVAGLPPSVGVYAGGNAGGASRFDAYGHTCALTPQGDAHCWGYNHFGQLGDGSKTDRPAPARVVGDQRFRMMALGDAHTCGVTHDGAVFCWGWNGRAELGVSVPPVESNRCYVADIQYWCSPLPLRVDGLSAAMVTAGDNHTCAAQFGGPAYCWGANDTGQTGTAQSSLAVLQPAPVAGGYLFVAVSAGPHSTCGIVIAGDVFCWGSGAFAPILAPRPQ
jgi:alpha-tubulin suppressor-like RCC1 family protein